MMSGLGFSMTARPPPTQIAAATAQLSANAAGFARVTIRPLLTAEEMDKAVAKWPPVRVPQQTIDQRLAIAVEVVSEVLAWSLSHQRYPANRCW
jgi:hypothetical protein